MAFATVPTSSSVDASVLRTIPSCEDDDVLEGLRVDPAQVNHALRVRWNGPPMAACPTATSQFIEQVLASR